MITKISIPRIKSVKIKGGVHLHVFRNRASDAVTQKLQENIRDMRHSFASDMAGYAVVVWSRDGATSTVMNVSRSSPIGKSMVPDMTRTALTDFLANSP